MFSPLIDLLEGWSRLVTEDLYICMLSQPRNKNDHKLAPKGKRTWGGYPAPVLCSQTRGDGWGGRASPSICIVIESRSHFPYQGLSPCLILNHQHQRKVITRVNYLFSIWLFTLLFSFLLLEAGSIREPANASFVRVHLQSGEDVTTLSNQ